MISPQSRLRWRRQIRQRKQQITDVSSETEVRLEQYFFRRLTRLSNVRRFMIGWSLLLIVVMLGLVVQHRHLIPYYQAVQATSGGTHREGVLGEFTNANPLYATGSVDGAVSKLLFSGLFKYDQENRLVPDLAVGYELDETETIYTITLRDDVYWHDGAKFSADDVAFTYQTIRIPDARSPFISSWRDTKIEVLGENTVRFELPNPLTSFVTSLTNGIAPRHLLADIPASQLRNHSAFNTGEPVGTGPFTWEALEVFGLAESREERIALAAYDRYHNGRPKMDRFVLRTFRDDERLKSSFNDGEISAIAGLSAYQNEDLDGSDVHTYAVPLTGQVGVFFKTSHDVLESKAVRQALVRSVNTADVLSGLDGPVVPSVAPLLPIHQGYDPELAQLVFDKDAAEALLDEDGWQVGSDGIRTKDGVPLSFTLSALNNADARVVSESLQRQWREVGIKAEVVLQPDVELQTSIAQHDYDALLHGIAIGSDPDVFAFWHSSQGEALAEGRPNLSEFSSAVADEALESGRTRSDPELRQAKYRAFMRVWRDQAPALMLYQPRFIYVTKSKIDGFNPVQMNLGTDRMYSAHEWLIRRVRIDRPRIR
jgi:peptide/nickel transport system substrate-binding protein